MPSTYSMTVTGLVRAPRAAVYRALLDPDAVARWRTPDDPGPRTPMTMTMTTTLRDAPGAAGGGTEVELRHDGIPAQVPAADDETGTRMTLAHLAAYVETTHQQADGER